MMDVDFFKDQFPERLNDKDLSLFLKSDSVTVLGTDDISTYPGFMIALRDQIGVAFGQQFGQEAYSQAEKVMKQLLT